MWKALRSYGMSRVARRGLSGKHGVNWIGAKAWPTTVGVKRVCVDSSLRLRGWNDPYYLGTILLIFGLQNFEFCIEASSLCTFIS